MENLGEIYVVVLLFCGSGKLEELKRYEEKALKLVRAHQGKLLCAFNPVASSQETPDEIHYLRFPNLSAFEAFKNDERHQALAEERSKAIARSEIYVSNRRVCYPE